jgi:hypothetical protein
VKLGAALARSTEEELDLHHPWLEPETIISAAKEAPVSAEVAKDPKQPNATKS